MTINKNYKNIINIVEKTLNGIKSSEIIELRNICQEDRYTYYKIIKLKYICYIGLIRDYTTKETEDTIFLLIHDIIHRISVDSNDNSELTISIS